MLTIVSDRWTELLRDGPWWRRACAVSWRFAPRCILPSVLLTGANLMSAVGGDYVINRIKHLQGGEITDMGPLLLLYMGILLGSVLVMVLCFVSLSQWLFKLTAFARIFYESELAHERARGSAAQPAAEIDRQAMIAMEKAVWQRWVYVMKVWAVASLIMLPPFLPLAAIILLHSMIAGPMPLDIKVLGWPMWLTSARAGYTALVVGTLLTIILSAYSFVVIVFSAISHMPAAKTAVVGLKESLRHAWPVLCLTTIIVVVNVVVTTPQMILSITPLAPLVKNVAVEACAQVWFGISSIFVWTLSLAPFCRITQQSEEAPGNG